MIRFSHTLFALPFALLSAVLAWRTKPQGFSWLELIGILLGMVLGRSAAMSFNRIVDRHYDAANPRTAGRHLPTGQLGVSTVGIFTALCAVGFVGSTAIFLWADPPNYWPLVLSGPVLLLICGYSFSKRFTALAHFWLGASLLVAPVAAWIAIRGMEDLSPAIVLGLAVFFWVSGFDIIYACQDTDFDQRTGLKSIPARVGIASALRIAMICHLIMLGLLFSLYWIANLGTVYVCGIGLVALLLFYEHSLVSPENLARVNQAFFHVNAVISVGLLLIVLLQLVLPW
jgi:4-hydroxybenzoate polyprenyltransferase